MRIFFTLFTNRSFLQNERDFIFISVGAWCWSRARVKTFLTSPFQSFLSPPKERESLFLLFLLLLLKMIQILEKTENSH